MVFDLVRSLGARRGELEVNVLASLSGQGRGLEWAPEVEYAVSDGTALEMELPFEGGRLAEPKLGVQQSFGTLDLGRSVHGVQYLGLYERESGSTSHAVLYLYARRWGGRVSTMSVVRVGQSGRVAGLLVNHATFYDLGAGGSDASVVGLEVNYRSGSNGGVPMMPQFHHKLAGRLGAQADAGIDKQRGARARPAMGRRVIQKF